jgi:YhcH/YjgK/YiaL family protein
MIIDKLTNWRRYSALAELRPAFEFLAGQTEACLAGGRVDIDGDRVYALVQAYTPKPIEEARFESHHRYIDIQYVCQGREMLGAAPAADLDTETPYDPDKDVAFHPKPKAFAKVALLAGYFAVCYPEDGHMPGCLLDSTDQVAKIVVKVRLA